MRSARTSILAAIAVMVLAFCGAAAAAATIDFAGMTWDIKAGCGLGPGPNCWSDSPESVFVDAQGALHLKIRNISGTWYCSEVIAQQPFGHGDYLFKVASNTELFDPNVVVGLFIYLDEKNEIDIELTRFGDPQANFTADYAVQPASTPGNLEQFTLGLTGDFSTHSFNWQANSIFFQSYHGHHDSLPGPSELLIHDYLYTGGDIPPESTERLRINFWLFQGNPPSNAQEHELIITDVIVTTAACNNNGTCDSGEDCLGCPADCISQAGADCGNNVCETADGENCLTCPNDCNGAQTGNPSNRYCCGDGASGQGAVDCSDPRCTGGGVSCTSTPVGGYCCGDGACEGAEDETNCAVDCTAGFCGDDTCDANEDECTCAADCGAPPAAETAGVDCADGLDNDCDGGADCADPDGDCDSDPFCAPPACDNDGVCEPGEDCDTCPNDCDSKVNGPPSGRYCCGNGVVEGPEGDGRCDGNP